MCRKSTTASWSRSMSCSASSMSTTSASPASCNGASISPDSTKLELGVRGEQTNLEITSTVAGPVADAAAALSSLGLNVEGNQIAVDNDYFELNPTAHIRWDATDSLQLRLSAARTVRRPSFDELNPTLLLDEDESVLGNPTLDQETALGPRRRLRSALERRGRGARRERVLSAHREQDRAERRRRRR